MGLTDISQVLWMCILRSGHEGPDRTRQALLPFDNVEFTNDPSAGSPTETLLRLLLPLNDQV